MTLCNITMIERVARGIATLRRHQDQTDTQFEGFFKHMRSVYEAEARAAIEAMRNPTQEMLSIDAPDMPAGGDVADIWRDMIDAALKR